MYVRWTMIMGPQNSQISGSQKRKRNLDESDDVFMSTVSNNWWLIKALGIITISHAHEDIWQPTFKLHSKLWCQSRTRESNLVLVNLKCQMLPLYRDAIPCLSPPRRRLPTMSPKHSSLLIENKVFRFIKKQRKAVESHSYLYLFEK